MGIGLAQGRRLVAAVRHRVADVARAYAGSPTGFDRRVTESDVRAAFRLVLGRAPDADGLHTYRAMVGRADVSELVGCLLSSEEFRRSKLHDIAARREHEDLVDVTTAEGLRFGVSLHDILNRPLRDGGEYEPHVAAAMDEVVRPGMTVCCVGANIGFHALRAARAVGHAGSVFAFEARPENAAAVLQNAARSGLSNVVVFPFAVADAVALYRYVRAQGTNGYIEPIAPLVDGDRELADARLVQAIPLDLVAPSMGRIDLLQLDVEGAEGLVLRGARRLLAGSPRPVIMSELCLGQLERTSQISGEEFLRTVVDLGYRLEVLRYADEPLPYGRDAAGLAQYARSQPTSQIDIRCLPE